MSQLRTVKGFLRTASVVTTLLGTTAAMAAGTKLLSLTVDSFPRGAPVYVDGQPKGNTPVTLSTTAGTHQVDLAVAGSGWQPFSQSINLTQSTTVYGELLPLLTVGPEGPMGPQGPAGAQGPAGESVTSGTIMSSDSTCYYGGSIFFVGGNVTYACNGAPGADGTVGPAGPQGLKGDAGPAGESVVGISLSPGANLNCPDGGSKFTVGGNVTYACNGAAGSQGLTGPQGPQGVPGPAGAAGPQGVPGPTGAAGPQGVPGPTGAVGPAGGVAWVDATGAVIPRLVAKDLGQYPPDFWYFAPDGYVWKASSSGAISEVFQTAEILYESGTCSGPAYFMVSPGYPRSTFRFFGFYPGGGSIQSTHGVPTVLPATAQKTICAGWGPSTSYQCKAIQCQPFSVYAQADFPAFERPTLSITPPLHPELP